MDRLISYYKKIINFFCSILEYMAIFCLAAMVVVIMIQVTGRYVFRITPGWSEELARQFMIIFSFIGILIGVRDKIHISMTVVVDFFLKRINLAIEVFGKVLTMVLGIMMSVNMGLALNTLRYNRLPGTGIPQIWIYIIPTAVGFLIAFVVFYQIYDHIKYGTDEQQAKTNELVQGENK